MDLRDTGSGHATTTNSIRQAGFGPGVLVLILQIAKGFVPAWLAEQSRGVCSVVETITRINAQATPRYNNAERV